MNLRASLVVGLMVCGCTAPEPTSQLLSIAPADAPEGTEVAVTLTGERLLPSVSFDFDAPAKSRADFRFAVKLGDVALQNVFVVSPQSLSAVVPPVLPAGVYDVEVVSPRGELLRLEHAFTVSAPGENRREVARYRVAPVGAQRVGVGFAVTIDALDSQDEVASWFAGSAALSDVSTQLAPRVAGPFVNGRWVGTLEVGAPVSGDVVTVRDAAGATGTSQPFDVRADASVLHFSQAPTTAILGDCAGPFVVELREVTGAVSAARVPMPLEFTSVPHAAQLFADSACASVGAASLAVGQSRTQVYARFAVIGSIELTAASPGFTSASTVVTVGPRPSERLAFVTPPRTVTAGDCSAAVTIGLVDSSGGASIAQAAVALSLTQTPTGAVSVFDDSSCATASSVTIAAGQSAVTVYLRGTVARQVSLTASAPGVSSVTQQLQIVPAAPSVIVFTTPPRTVVAGSCSSPIAVELHDAFGNVAPVSVVTTLTAANSAPVSVTMFSDACSTAAAVISLAAGQSSAQWFLSGAQARSVDVLVTGAGLTGATQTEQIVPGAPASLVITSAPQTLTAGACSAAIDVEARDASGNAVPVSSAVSISLSATPSVGPTLFADACVTAASAVTVAASTATTRFFVSSAVLGAITVTVSAAGLSSASQTVQINPTTKNLEVPIEMIDFGVSSSAATATLFARSAVRLDATDYDGAVTYWLEIVAHNRGSVAHGVDLVVAGNVSVLGSKLMVPPNAAPTLMARVPFTPPVGPTVYRLLLDQTPEGDDTLLVTTARVVVRQSGATKTRIYIPLHASPGLGNLTASSVVSKGDAAPVNETWADANWSGTWGQGNPAHFPLWRKDSSAFGTLAPGTPWSFEAIIQSQGGVRSVGLFNANGAQVAMPALSTSVLGVPTFLRSEFSDGATNFTDLDSFEVKSDGNGALIYKAGLWVTLNPISKGEIFYRVSKGNEVWGPYSPLIDVNSRVFLDLAAFTNPTVSLEATVAHAGYSYALSDLLGCPLCNVGTASATQVAGSVVTWPATRSRVRSSPFTVPNAHYFGLLLPANTYTGDGQLNNALLVVGFQ